MFFSIDYENKIIFGWSAKCGCSHIMRIYWFLRNNSMDVKIHTKNDVNKLPNDIEKYTTIIVSRNPYKRIISGFLDKYKPRGQYRYLWKYDDITFSMFVNELEKTDWKMIDKHHFTPQTSEHFHMKILNSKCLKIYDIENIDYNYIEKLYNKTIPECILHRKEGHERAKYDITTERPVYDLNLNEYLFSNVDIKYFYNKELKQKIFNFYKNDFMFFNRVGMDYINTSF
jgi:hypothetical protein